MRCRSCPKLSNNIVQKGLAFARVWGVDATCILHNLLRAARQRGRCGIILRKDALGVSNKIIQKGLDFHCDRSVSVAMLMRAAAALVGSRPAGDAATVGFRW
jgi:hypothetical protein